MVEFLAIGAHAVQRTGVKRDSRALVVGSGPIGLGVAFFAKIAGADVTVVDAAPDKIEATRALGFRTFTVADTEGDAFNAVKRTGFDSVFDATGSIRAMNASIFHARNGGDYTLVGVIKGDLVFPDSEVHRRELTIRAARNAQKRDFDHVIDSIRKGLVPTDLLATHVTDFDGVPANMTAWAHSREGLIKAIVNM
jgi:2-desacetyl-2-hydroxyethyl bacteriochlorophyllide A dehydrogenase